MSFLANAGMESVEIIDLIFELGPAPTFRGFSPKYKQVSVKSIVIFINVPREIYEGLKISQIYAVNLRFLNANIVYPQLLLKYLPVSFKFFFKRALNLLMTDVVQSHAFAQQEVQRYSLNAPGQ